MTIRVAPCLLSADPVRSGGEVRVGQALVARSPLFASPDSAAVIAAMRSARALQDKTVA